MKLEDPEYSLLSFPSCLLLTHINVHSLWGSSMNSQELYMKTCELVQTHSGHMEKLKTRNVKKFSQGHKACHYPRWQSLFYIPECMISSLSFSLLSFFFKWRSNSLVGTFQHHLNLLPELMKSYLPLAIDPLISQSFKFASQAMVGGKSGVPSLTWCPESCWETRFSVLRKGMWGA